jgi:hypothetical protein
MSWRRLKGSKPQSLTDGKKTKQNKLFLNKTTIQRVFKLVSKKDLLLIKWWRVKIGSHDIQHNDAENNDTQPNDTQHNDAQLNGTQHKDTQHNDAQHNDTHHKDTQHNDAQDNVTQHNELSKMTLHNGLIIMTLNIMTVSIMTLHNDI